MYSVKCKLCVIQVLCLLITAVTGYSQKAISFDSPGDYLEIPHDPTLAPSHFTIELWLKLEDTGDPEAAGGEQTILDKRDGETGFNLRLAGTDFPLPVFAIVLPGDVSMYDVVRWNTWHHVAVTQDTDSLRIYLDGALKAANPNSYAWDTEAPLRVGEFLGYPGAYLGLRGDIDDLRIWSYSRTGTEIRSAMHEKLSGMESGLAAYWDFDTIAVNTISDRTTNGNDGVIYGGATLVESNAPVGFIPPETVVGLRAYGGENQVQLAWTPAEGDIESTHVYRGDSMMFVADESSLLAEVMAPASTYTDSTAEPGKNHYYCVRTSVDDHLSIQSNVALGRTLGVTGGYETGVYYYPWYGPIGDMHEWDGQYTRDFLIPRQPPMLGHYSSRDPVVIRQHLKWMEACGIDFTVMSWWGNNSREDITLRDHILGELDSSSVKFSIYYESALLGIDQGQIPIDESDEAYLVADFNYIADTYFEHPNYLRVNDKPVIFIYLSGIYSGDFKEAFTRVRSEISARGFEVFLVGDEVGWGETSVSHMEFLDAVSPYIVLPRQIQEGEYPGNRSFFADLSVQAGEWEMAAGPSGKFIIPGVIPGFNNRIVSADGFAVPRQTGEGESGTSMLEEYIRVMLPFVDPELKMIMITSWNEWHEDTQVEPTVVTPPTSQDVSAGGDYYTWNYTYEGYGFQNLEVIRKWLAGELPEPDYTNGARSSISRTGELEIYPNPAHSALSLMYTVSEPGIFSVEVYDIMGQRVLSLLREYRDPGTYHQEFNIQQLGEGFYILQMNSGKFAVVKKLLKQ